MKYSFQSLSMMKYIGIGFSSKGETVYWYTLPNGEGWVALTAKKVLVEYTEEDPSQDFDFIAVEDVHPVYY